MSQHRTLYRNRAATDARDSTRKRASAVNEAPTMALGVNLFSLRRQTTILGWLAESRDRSGIANASFCIRPTPVVCPRIAPLRLSAFTGIRPSGWLRL